MSAIPISPTTSTHPPHSPTSAVDPSAHKIDPNRRSSFNFLRRQKSADGSHKPSMLSKKHKAQQYPPPQSVPRVPPQLPTPAPLSMDSTSFIGENAQQQYTSSRGYMSPGGSSYTQVSPLHQSSHPPNFDVPVPPMPAGMTPYSRNGDYDPYARTESMTHRGRYSYASSAISGGTNINSPRRVRRRKDPTPFNILVIGAQNSGKTSFIEFLRTSLKDRKRDNTPSPPITGSALSSPFTPHYLETEFDNERVGVTLWDSQGLEKKFVDLQLREMSSFLESKFEETFTEEQKVVRAPGVRDTHIHCVFLILDPARLDSNIAHTRRHANGPSNRFEEPLRLMGILDEDLDVQVLRTLQGKTTVIPVISKADTITANHMAMLKRAVWDSLKQAKLDPLEALALAGDDESDTDPDRLDERDEDDALHEDVYDRDHGPDIIDNLIDRSDDSNEENDEHPSEIMHNPQARPQPHRRSPSGLSARLSQAAFDASSTETPYLPMSLISPDTYEPGVIGRRFPWGFADPYDPEHCDFVRLKDSVFSEWRAELREASREIWYEGWRTSRLNHRTGTSSGQASNGSMPNGRARNVSGTGSNLTSPNPYGGGPVGYNGNVPPGTAYSPTSQSAGPRSPHATDLSSPGSPEMVKGVFRQGVNAF